MNKWQQIYCNKYCSGKMPRSEQEQVEFELLGKIKSKVIVYFPDFNGINGFQPAHEETYVITEDNCDMPNGLISVSVLISNLKLWIFRGYKIKTE